MRYDKHSLAQINRSNVFDLIRREAPIGRAEIARKIGLSIPTVMKITDDFIAESFVREVGKGKSNGGKRPELLELVPDSKHIIGIGIGRSKTNVVIMNLAGHVLCQKIMITGDTANPAIWIDRLMGIVEEVILNSQLPLHQFMGIGVGMPGIIDENSGTVLFSPDFKWENVDLINPILDRFRLPVVIENANRALAMGEYLFGAAQDSQNFLTVNLGHGIGGAMIQKGEFSRGSSGSSGEIGHFVLEKDGPICNCGNRGCLEAIASGNAIARDAKIAVLQGENTSLARNWKDNLNALEAKCVFEAAADGDEISIKIVERAAEFIGIGLANYINLMDPDLIILYGGLTYAGDQFITRIKSELSARQMKFAGRQVRIVVSKMGENGTAVGSGSLVLKQFIKYGHL